MGGMSWLARRTDAMAAAPRAVATRAAAGAPAAPQRAWRGLHSLPAPISRRPIIGFGLGPPAGGLCRPSRIGAPDWSCRALKTGIVGLPNVGKSTLFNALVEDSQAQAANFPFCTIEPNVGTVPVPDKRLHQLSDMSKSKSTISTTIEFVDIAGKFARLP